MSTEDVQQLHNTITQGDFTSFHTLENNSTDILECLSIMIDEDNSNTEEVQEVVLDDQLLGATLTAITLADGTQAFVINNLGDQEADFKEGATLELDNGETILVRNFPELSDEKTVQLEINPAAFIQTEEAVEDTENTLSQVEFIDGTAYMVNSHINVEDSLWQIDKESIQKKDGKAVVNKIAETKTRHPCPREGCTKVYSTPHHLKVHERSHTGQRPYRCAHSKCKKSFLTGYSLKAHLRTHTGEKPYKCPTEECNKSFKTSGDLLKHIRTHTGERPFVCPFEGCGRSFTTSNIRKIHVRTHTGERPYKCTQPKCNKAFASATNYKNHIRIHSGEKPYVCSVDKCGRRFTEYSSLYKHHLVHTQQRPFECKLCSRRYRQSSTLVMHKKTAHGFSENLQDVHTCSQDADDVPPTLIKGKSSNETRQSKFTVEIDEPFEISAEYENLADNETQILLVSDPSELAALQQAGFHEIFEDSEMDASFEGLNIKIEDMAFGWS